MFLFITKKALTDVLQGKIQLSPYILFSTVFFQPAIIFS